MLTTSPCEEKKEKKIMTYEKKDSSCGSQTKSEKKTSRSVDQKLDGTGQRSMRLQKLRAEHDKK